MTTPHHKTSIAGIFATATMRKSRAVVVGDDSSTVGNDVRVARALASEMAASNNSCGGSSSSNDMPQDDAASVAVAVAASVADENASQPNTTLVELLDLKQQLEAAKTRNTQVTLCFFVFQILFIKTCIVILLYLLWSIFAYFVKFSLLSCSMNRKLRR